MCTKAVFDTYFAKGTHTYCNPGDYTSEEVQKKLEDSTIFAFTLPDWKDHATLSDACIQIWNGKYYSKYVSGSGYVYAHHNAEVIAKHYTGPIYVDDSTIETTVSGWWNKSTNESPEECKIRANAEDCYATMTYTDKDIETTTIPGHYEDSPDAPYAIKDQYRRIDSSPWLVNCTVGSLEAALIKAKKLIEMIGLENVKVIKLVTIDQFVKIR